MKITRVVICIMLLTQFACAHEFWLKPEKFQTAVSQEISRINIRVGMNFEGVKWKGNLKKIISLDRFFGGDRASLIATEKLTEPIIDLATPDSGQYLVGFTNDSAYIELKARAFHKYVRSEGLDHVVKERERLGEAKKPGRELYRRCAKTLVRKGQGEGAVSYSGTFGFPLEFVALEDPFGDSALQSFQLTYNQQPLIGAQVVILHRNEGRVNRRELKTDQQGTISFPIKRKGEWMLTNVHMVRLENNQRAEWQSFWGSYTFGYQSRK